MSRPVMLRPGLATLADWRAIYRGAPVSLDPVSRVDVEAGLASLRAVLAKRDYTPAEDGAGSPTVVELLQRSGDILPGGLVRLLVALKIAALGQGLSGVRWKLVHGLERCLAADLVPAIPAQNGGDRLALSHLFGLLTGAGEAIVGTERHPAGKALKRAGLAPLKLNAHEKRALLSGTEPSTAFALAGLFEAEGVFQSALVAGALAAAASNLPGTVLHPRVHRLSRHPGQNDVARAFRALLGADEADAALPDSEIPAEVIEQRRFYSRMGACLDLLRQAGETLQRAANGASEDRLVLWQSEQVVAGVEDDSASVLAADLIALALRELGGLAERRIAAIPNGAAHAAPNGPANGAKAMVAGFLSEIRERARPAGFASGAADRADVEVLGVARLLPVAGTASLLIAIEFLAAARACDRGAPREAMTGLAAVRRLLRDASPPADGEQAISVADLAGAAELVRSGALAAAAGIELPGVLATQPNSSVRARQPG